MTTSSRDIAADIAELQRAVRDLQRAPRLANASIEGFPLTVNDDGGQQRQTIGLQPDGTYTTVDVNGPPPPVPSLPTLEARPGTLVVTWDGKFLDDVAPPADWDHVEVHVSTTSGYTPTDTTEVITFHSLKGGSVTLALDPVPQYVVLQAVSTSLTESAPTVEVSGTPLPAATGSGGVKTYSEDEPPVGLGTDDDGSLWFDSNDGNNPYRWNGTTLLWVSIRDATIANAAAAASAAQTQANTALTAAEAAQATADGAIRTYYQSSPPWANGSSQPPEVVGDLWFDIDDGQAYRWSGTTWVIIEDNSIAAALAAAQNAQTTADGKITAYYQTTTPTIGKLGDLWYDTDDGNKPYFCSQESPQVWTPIRDGSIAIAQAAAATALTAAQDAQATADGKATAYFQAAEPGGLTAGDVGDLWFDTDDGNKMYRWSGAAWVVAQDQAIATALTNAANAQTAAGGAQATADSKIVTLYQAAPPSGTGRVTGDLWIDTDNDNLLSRWNGAAWVPVPVGTNAIDTGSVTSQNTQFRPGGGMMSNLIPDPEFLDSVWRAQRTGDDWSTWTFGQIAELAPLTLAGYTFGAKVTGTSVTPDDDFGPKGGLIVAMNINTALVAADVLFTSAPVAVTGSRVYQAYLGVNRSQTAVAAEVEWLTSGLVSISTSPISVTASGPTNVTSPSNAAFARLRLKAIGAVTTGSISGLGVSLYLGGAGIEPGDWTAAIDFAPSYVGQDEITLVRNIPISRVQDYYGDITGIAVNAEAHFVLREYAADGSITDSTTAGQPTISAQPTPAWVGDSGPVTAVGDDTVRADLMLQAGPITAGQAGRIEFSQPILALTGFTSRDGKRRATFSPKTLEMAGENVEVYIDSDDGLAWVKAPLITLGSAAESLSIQGNNVSAADLSSLTNTFPTFPYYSAYLAASVTVANATSTGISWTDDAVSPSSGITRSGSVFTVPTAGRYRVTFQAYWAAIASPAGNRLAQLITGAVIGTGTVLASASEQPSATAASSCLIAKTIPLAAGAQIRTQVSHTQGATAYTNGLQGNANGDLTYVQIEWVGP